MKGYWQNGVQDAKWTFYNNIYGKVDRILIYENGEPIKRIKADK